MRNMDGAMSFLFILISMLLINLAQRVECLTIELIHPFSPESPFYNPNITYLEMIERFSSRPRSRGQSHITASKNMFADTKGIRTDLQYVTRGYLAKLNLGTFPGENPTYKTYYLHFDTSSDVSWLQCEDCAKRGGHCFDQNGSPYPNSKSSSYTPLPYNYHPLCYPDEHIDPYCSYKIGYNEGSHSIGILAYETFTFASSHTHLTETTRIVIGCGFINNLEVFDENANEAGVMGMSWGPHSFVRQIDTHSHGRFSYCLPPLLYDGWGPRPTVLRFGSDTPATRGLHSLMIHRHWREESYYVKLEDISINNRRLHIPIRYFAKTSPEKGGCFFDTGSTLTSISQKAYRILKVEMDRHLTTIVTTLKISRSKGQFDLCYKRRSPLKGYANLPIVTFHFEGGADLVMQRDIAFVSWPETSKEYVCMGIVPARSDNIAIIGAQGQANHVFVYDLPGKRMYFGPRDCARNP